MDAGHIGAHEHDAPAAGFFEVLIECRVGEIIGVEPGSFVLDLDTDLFFVEAPSEADGGASGKVTMAVDESVGD